MTTDLVLPDFDDFGDQTIRGNDSPDEATAATQALLQADRESEQPTIDDPGETHVVLERGICREGTWYRDAEVRELTGADEEAIAAAGASSHKILSTLLLRGVRSIGNEPMTRQLADELLIGDREYLVMEIRRVTFGDILEFEGLPCPHCEELTDLSVPLVAIPFVHLDDPEKTEFSVPLRKGRTALVRLPNGADQAAVLAIRDGNGAKQDTEILNRCVLRIRNADGSEVRRPPAIELTMSDRKTILKTLTDMQPGPRYGNFAYTHETCGQEVPLPINLAILFRGV
ncbi:hypothetical protein ACFQ61_08320 [Streptomyces sp. NPDC056500]|uniref:T4 family baseplate hub assembly chaperone n=1 Tax=Streptomyces sp. NPDC056500 TaxID=3345840 RepID=UPI0036BBBEE2